MAAFEVITPDTHAKYLLTSGFTGHPKVVINTQRMLCAGAALPQATWERFQALARRITGQDVWLTTSWGSTETSPAIASAHWQQGRAGVIGLPLPGMALKFVPVTGDAGTKQALRVRGVSVFPGYLDAPQLTAQAFDAEGCYCIGDAGRLVDAQQPERGVVFDGRVAEDFKLTTGTWASVGTLRVRVVSALAPLAQDVVVTGHDRDAVGVLVFPSAAAAALAPQAQTARIAEGLQALKGEGGGSSQVPTRALLLRDPPRVDNGEITDKGYINQSAVARQRAADVARLYAGGPDVVVI